MSARSYVLNKHRQGNITVNRSSAEIEVVLHRTAVIKDDGNYITIASGGWLTVTTKTAINRYFSLVRQPYSVSQVKGEWFVNGLPFVDGMRLIKL